MILGAVGTEQASSGTCLAVGSDRKALLADLTIGQLTWILRPLLLIHHLICQRVIIIIIIGLTSTPGLATSELLALLGLFNSLLSLPLLGLLFGGVRLVLAVLDCIFGLLLLSGLLFGLLLGCVQPSFVVVTDLSS